MRLMPTPGWRTPLYPQIDFVRRKYGHELLIDAGWIRDYDTFIVDDEPHSLSFFEILLITDGSGSVWLDEAKHRVLPGRVLVTTPGQLRRWDARGLQGLCAFFTPEFMGADVTSVEVNLDPASSAAFRERLNQMQGEIRALRDDSPDLLRAWLTELTIRVNRLSAGARRGQPSRQARWALEFIRLLRANGQVRHDVPYYANALGITAGHLNAAARVCLGRSAGQLIRDYVVAEARRRLWHTNDNAADIAEQLGFADASYFTRFFLRETGLRPSAFRAAIHGKHQPIHG